MGDIYLFIIKIVLEVQDGQTETIHDTDINIKEKIKTMQISAHEAHCLWDTYTEDNVIYTIQEALENYLWPLYSHGVDQLLC